MEMNVQFHATAVLSSVLTEKKGSVDPRAGLTRRKIPASAGNRTPAVYPVAPECKYIVM